MWTLCHMCHINFSICRKNRLSVSVTCLRWNTVVKKSRLFRHPLCVLKLFSDYHTLWMGRSFLQGKGTECRRGLGIHLCKAHRHSHTIMIALYCLFKYVNLILYRENLCVFLYSLLFESYCNVTLLLQAWRKYDTDRSGYIESNELKVKHNNPNSAKKWMNVGSVQTLLHVWLCVVATLYLQLYIKLSITLNIYKYMKTNTSLAFVSWVLHITLPSGFPVRPAEEGKQNLRWQEAQRVHADNCEHHQP